MGPVQLAVGTYDGYCAGLLVITCSKACIQWEPAACT